MTRAPSSGATARATGDLRACRDGDDLPPLQLATVQRLYDTALAGSSEGGERPFQRYLNELIQAPLSAGAPQR